MPGRYEWGKCLLLNGACRGPVHRLGSGGVAQNWELGALFFNHWAPLWLQPNHQGGSGLLKTITTRQWSSHQSVRSGTSCTSELPHSCRTCPAVWAAASRTAFPPADISESYCPISTSPFAASSSQPCAGPIVSGHPGNSFIQLRGLLGDFGCKLSAGRWGLRTTGPSGVSSRATGAGAGGWRGGQHSKTDRSLMGRLPPVATGSGTDLQAMPVEAGLWLAPPQASPRSRGNRALGLQTRASRVWGGRSSVGPNGSS